MSLRPRYSLLTLLVLTALVAGGVKLWYGPHHVVEQRGANLEIEYTYTRDWKGKCVSGPLVRRITYRNGKLRGVHICYFRAGAMLALVSLRQPDVTEFVLPEDLYSVLLDVDNSPILTEEEKREWKEAIERERQPLLQHGKELFEIYQDTSE